MKIEILELLFLYLSKLARTNVPSWEMLGTKAVAISR